MGSWGKVKGTLGYGGSEMFETSLELQAAGNALKDLSGFNWEQANSIKQGVLSPAQGSFVLIILVNVATKTGQRGGHNITFLSQRGG